LGNLRLAFGAPQFSDLDCDETPPRQGLFQESEIEGYKHQDNADVRHQPLPEMMPEKQQVYANDNGNHHHNVKRDEYASCHFILRYGGEEGCR
jgi:hypothetical protein